MGGHLFAGADDCDVGLVLLGGEGLEAAFRAKYIGYPVIIDLENLDLIFSISK